MDKKFLRITPAKFDYKLKVRHCKVKFKGQKTPYSDFTLNQAVKVKRVWNFDMSSDYIVETKDSLNEILNPDTNKINSMLLEYNNIYYPYHSLEYISIEKEISVRSVPDVYCYVTTKTVPGLLPWTVKEKKECGETDYVDFKIGKKTFKTEVGKWIFLDYKDFV